MATFENQIIITASTNLKKVGKEMQKTFKNIGRGADKATRSMKRLGKASKATGEAIKKAGQKAIIPVTGGIAALGIGALKQAAKIENLEVAFESLTGSAEKGQKVLAELLEFSERTPFDPDQVANVGQSLLGFGVEVDEIQDKLKFLGDIAAGTGKDFGELAAIYGKTVSKTKADTETLNQLAEAGVPIIKTLGEQYNLTAEQVFMAAEQGKLSSKVIEKALRSLATGTGQFANQMEKQSKTIGGLWSTLRGRLTLIMADIGKDIKEAFNLEELIPRIGDYIKTLSDRFRALSPETKKQAVMIVALLAVLPPLLIGLGSLIATAGFMITGFSAAFAAIKVFAGIVVAVTAPIAGLVVGIGALAAAIYLLVDDWGAVGDWLIKYWNNTVEILSNAIMKIINFFGIDILPIAEKYWTPLVDFFNGLWESIAGIFDKGISKVTGTIDSVKSKINAVSGFFGFGDDPATPQAANISGTTTQKSQVDINVKTDQKRTSVQTSGDKGMDINTTLGVTNPLGAL